MRDIKESDWKIFKRVREVALERFCERVLDEIGRIGSDATRSKRQRYVAIYRLVRERDKEINPIFDHLSRSRRAPVGLGLKPDLTTKAAPG